jgi:predicted nuclease with TOPRIM domain
MNTPMERERYEAIIAGLQELLANADANHQAIKKIAEVELEKKQLEKKITENENEIKKLKAKIDEIDFENRILKTKIAAEESEKNHLQARVDEFDIIKAEQAGKNAPVNTLTAPQAQPEIVYLNNKITKQKNLKGWVSLGIVLIITAVVLFLLNAAYKI